MSYIITSKESHKKNLFFAFDNSNNKVVYRKIEDGIEYI